MTAGEAVGPGLSSSCKLPIAALHGAASHVGTFDKGGL